jgi:hypothetical protein
MFTLSIEHAISDFPTRKRTFDRFAEARRNAGVVSHRIRRPVEDPHYLVIELEFDAQENADNFRQFLHNVVWANRDASPALVGAPTSRILEEPGGRRLAALGSQTPQPHPTLLTTATN